MYVHQVLTPNGDATELGLYRFFGSCIKVFHVHFILCLPSFLPFLSSSFFFFLPVFFFFPSFLHFIHNLLTYVFAALFSFILLLTNSSTLSCHMPIYCTFSDPHTSQLFYSQSQTATGLEMEDYRAANPKVSLAAMHLPMSCLYSVCDMPSSVTADCNFFYQALWTLFEHL